jgi:hypothetical protein
MPPIDIRPRGSGVLNDLDSGAIAHRRPTTRLTRVLAAAGGDTHSSEYRAEVGPDPRMSDKAAEGHKHVSPIRMPDRHAELNRKPSGTLWTEPFRLDMVEVRTRPRKAVGALGRLDAGRPRRGCQWYRSDSRTGSRSCSSGYAQAEQRGGSTRVWRRSCHRSAPDALTRLEALGHCASCAMQAEWRKRCRASCPSATNIVGQAVITGCVQRVSEAMPCP